MNEKELLELFTSEIDKLKATLDNGNIDVHTFYSEVVELNNYIKNQIKYI
jgi:hypothetical protein